MLTVRQIFHTRCLQIKSQQVTIDGVWKLMLHKRILWANKLCFGDQYGVDHVREAANLRVSDDKTLNTNDNIDEDTYVHWATSQDNADIWHTAIEGQSCLLP